jgi:hypothetical protein
MRRWAFPKLKLEASLFGYSLGEWPRELERATEPKRRRKDARMNTEVREVRED